MSLIIIFSKSFRAVVAPMQPPIQRVPLFWARDIAVCEIVDLYLCCPIYLHVVGREVFSFFNCLCQFHLIISGDLLVTHTVISLKTKHISL